MGRYYKNGKMRAKECQSWCKDNEAALEKLYKSEVAADNKGKGAYMTCCNWTPEGSRTKEDASACDITLGAFLKWTGKDTSMVTAIGGKLIKSTDDLGFDNKADSGWKSSADA